MNDKPAGRNLHDWINAYVAYSDNTEPRESYRRWVAISAVAAALQRKCWMRLGDMIVFYPNLFIVLVGPPAARKGTAMSPIKQMLDYLGIPLAAEETSKQKLVAKLGEPGIQAEIRQPSGLMETCSSLTIYSTELAHFIGYQNQEFLTTLNKLFDCDKLDKDTISRGVEGAERTWGNLLGAITPALLMSCMPKDVVGSGFTSRALFVYEEDKARRVDFPTLTHEQKLAGEALPADLERIHMMEGEFTMTEITKTLYSKWRKHWDNVIPGDSHMLEGYADRRPTHLCKLMMIFSASRAGDMQITEVDFMRAAEILEETEEKMPRAFEGLGASPLLAVQQRVITYLAQRTITPLVDLKRLFLSEVGKIEMAEILANLEDVGYIQIGTVAGPDGKPVGSVRWLNKMEVKNAKEIDPGLPDAATA